MARPSVVEAVSNAAGSKNTRRQKPAERTNPTASKTREGKKQISGWFAPAVSKQLGQISLDEEKTIQDLLGESLNLLFEKYKKPTIA